MDRSQHGRASLGHRAGDSHAAGRPALHARRPPCEVRGRRGCHVVSEVFARPDARAEGVGRASRSTLSGLNCFHWLRFRKLKPPRISHHAEGGRRARNIPAGDSHEQPGATPPESKPPPGMPTPKGSHRIRLAHRSDPFRVEPENYTLFRGRCPRLSTFCPCRATATKPSHSYLVRNTGYARSTSCPLGQVARHDLRRGHFPAPLGTYRSGSATFPSTWSTTSFMARIKRLPILECFAFLIGFLALTDSCQAATCLMDG